MAKLWRRMKTWMVIATLAPLLGCGAGFTSGPEAIVGDSGSEGDAGRGSEAGSSEAEAGPPEMCCSVTSPSETRLCGTGSVCYQDGNCSISFGMPMPVAGMAAPCQTCAAPVVGGECAINADGNGMTAILATTNDHSIICVCGRRIGCATSQSGGAECL